MKKIVVNKKARARGWKVLALWITITVALGLVGPGMALWDVQLPAIGLSTNIGNIDPVLTGFEIQSDEEGSVNYTADSAYFLLEDVEPGSEVTFRYTLQNDGSIPVIARVEAGPDMPDEISLLESDSITVDAEDKATGEFTLQVNGDYDDTYDPDLKLVYQQWNAPLD